MNDSYKKRHGNMEGFGETPIGGSPGTSGNPVSQNDKNEGETKIDL